MTSPPRFLLDYPATARGTEGEPWELCDVTSTAATIAYELGFLDLVRRSPTFTDGARVPYWVYRLVCWATEVGQGPGRAGRVLRAARRQQALLAAAPALVASTAAVRRVLAVLDTDEAALEDWLGEVAC